MLMGATDVNPQAPPGERSPGICRQEAIHCASTWESESPSSLVQLHSGNDLPSQPTSERLN